MKRSQELETLSWEHHNGLVTALRLKKGILKQAPADQMAAFIHDAWTADLKRHFTQEEHTLTEILKSSAAGSALFDRMMSEHERLAELVEITSGAGCELAYFQEFSDLLEAHIRFEERELFPFVEAHCPPEKLVVIGKWLHSQHSSACRTHRNEFWK
jgi:hemerythrin-like domain-containing protein